MKGTGNVKNREEIIGMFMELFNISRINSEKLVDSGYTSLEFVSKASKEELTALGLSAQESDRIIAHSSAINSPDLNFDKKLSVEYDDVIKKWLDDVDTKSAEMSDTTPKQDNETQTVTDVNNDNRSGLDDINVTQWLSGDTGSIDKWIEESANVSTVSVINKEKESAEDLEVLKAREEAAYNVLKKYIDRLKVGDLNPMKLIEENVEKTKELEEEKKKRTELEREIKKLMNGSVALIKHVKATEKKNYEDNNKTIMGEIEKLSNENKQLNDELKKLKENMGGSTGMPLPAEGINNIQVNELLAKNSELNKELITRNNEIETMKVTLNKLEEEKRILKESMDPSKIGTDLNKKLNDYLTNDTEKVSLMQEVNNLKADLKIKNDEIAKLKEVVSFKESEMKKWEDMLREREEKLSSEKKKFEYEMNEAKKAGTSVINLASEKKLKDLESEISRKEEELRAREKYINAKVTEIKLKEKGMVSDELKMAEAERMLEIKEEKVKTGIARLDDLLFGGIPMGSNILVSGPAHSGKEMFLRLFIQDGLKKGVPAVMILTDKTVQQVEEEMAYILPTFNQYMNLGLIKYIDTYSTGVGGEKIKNENITYLNSQKDFDALTIAVESAISRIKDKGYKYYRLGFESLSTLITYSSPIEAFKFLQPFVGKRKIEKAVSMYMIDTGIHSDADIQTLNHAMDGELSVKLENLKTYFSVKGITDTQSRAPINYTFTKRSISIGSFSLDHIR